MSFVLDDMDIKDKRGKMDKKEPIVNLSKEEKAILSENAPLLSHYFHNLGTSSEKHYAKLLKDADLDPALVRYYGEEHKVSNKFATKNDEFTFIDLFAGIGGMRLGAQANGGRCVFSSEWDKYSQLTYDTNFGEVPFGDITKIDEKDIPAHDFLMAGFPCQTFSIAGKRAGFSDTRGTMFFEVARILAKHRPASFMLENVKGLVGHDKGRTLKTILAVLRDDLGYTVPDPKVLNSRNFGVPQNRERIFIVGFLDPKHAENYIYPKGKPSTVTVADILEKKEVSAKYYLSTQYLKTLENHKARHAARGNGFGYQVLDPKGISSAVIVGGMGLERNLVLDKRLKDFTPVTKIVGGINKEYIRRLTPRECGRLQGFPEKLTIPVSDAQAYKQFGNSVTVPAIAAVVKSIRKAMEK